MIRRYIILLVLWPALVFGQISGQVQSPIKGDVTINVPVSYGSDFVTINFCSEYQTVYDAFTVKPDATDAYRQNLLVERGLAHGWWVVLDYFGLKAVHTNTNGEALLNWKQPAGGASLLDAGKGMFDSGTEGWSAIGTNTIVNDAGALKITYAGGSPSSNGAYVPFTAAGALTTNLTVGKYYKIRVRAKVNAGSVLLYLEALGGTMATVTQTDFTWFSVIAPCTNASTANIQMAGMGAGEIIWIDEYSIQEWTNALAVNGPTHTAYQGFLFNGTTNYVNSRFTPSVDGVQYTQNSASQILYVRTNVAVNNAGHGAAVNVDSKDMYLGPKTATGNAQIRTNDATTLSVANANGSGMYINTRTAAAINKLYRNKVAIVNGTTASTGVPTHAFYVGCYNDDNVATGFRADQVALDAYGAGFTQALVDYMTDDFEEYMDSYSTGVIAMIYLERIMQLQYLAFQIRINEHEKALINPMP